VDDSFGWAVGERKNIFDTGIILHTNDGGNTWTAQLPETLILGAVDFYTPQFGVAVGTNVWWESVVLVTWDGGQHWEDQYYDEGYNLHDVALISEHIGWAVGWNGTILHTTNGGHTWNRVSSPTTGLFNKVIFVEDDSVRVGYIFGENGDNGVLLRSESPITAIQSAPTSVPTQVRLGSPYPNPFNPSTTIHYDLPKAAHVSLRVYNLQGQLIATLLNDTQPAGYHQVLWDGTDQFRKPVASGVYFCRMVTPNYTKTVKMMLVR